MKEKSIEELILQMDTIPFLFVGSGFSKRYFHLPDWVSLLKQMTNQINVDEFAYNVYEDEARSQINPYGINPAIATILEKDFNN